MHTKYKLVLYCNSNLTRFILSRCLRLFDDIVCCRTFEIFWFSEKWFFNLGKFGQTFFWKPFFQKIVRPPIITVKANITSQIVWSWYLKVEELPTQGQKIKFHEIKTGGQFFDHEIETFCIFQEIKSSSSHSISWSRRFSWDRKLLIMLFRVLISWTIY